MQHTHKEHTFFIVCSELCLYQTQKALDLMYARKRHCATYTILLGVDKFVLRTAIEADESNDSGESSGEISP